MILLNEDLFVEIDQASHQPHNIPRLRIVVQLSENLYLFVNAHKIQGKFTIRMERRRKV